MFIFWVWICLCEAEREGWREGRREGGVNKRSHYLLVGLHTSANFLRVLLKIEMYEQDHFLWCHILSASKSPYTALCSLPRGRELGDSAFFPRLAHLKVTQSGRAPAEHVCARISRRQTSPFSPPDERLKRAPFPISETLTSLSQPKNRFHILRPIAAIGSNRSLSLW